MSVNKIITDNIIKLIEGANISDFESPFQSLSLAGEQKSLATGNAYTGINQLITLLSAANNRYTSGNWGTLKQFSKLNKRIRKEELKKSTCITFYKTLTKEDDSGNESSFPMLRYYRVYNEAQTEGYEPPKSNPNITREYAPAIDKLVKSHNVKLLTGGIACYSPNDDAITMPDFAEFCETSDKTIKENYYSTLLHELTHWTGHSSRLNRDFGNKFKSQKYAREELVAEIGAVFLSLEYGVAGKNLNNHGAYLKSWLQLLKSDPKAIFNAVRDAKKAFNFLTQKEFNQSIAA